MKKISLLLVLALGLALTACGSSQKPETSNLPTAVGQASATQVPQQTAPQDMTRSDSQGRRVQKPHPDRFTREHE